MIKMLGVFGTLRFELCKDCIRRESTVLLPYLVYQGLKLCSCLLSFFQKYPEHPLICIGPILLAQPLSHCPNLPHNDSHPFIPFAPSSPYIHFLGPLWSLGVSYINFSHLYFKLVKLDYSYPLRGGRVPTPPTPASGRILGIGAG